jgi:hypothetical protein
MRPRTNLAEPNAHRLVAFSRGSSARAVVLRAKKLIPREEIIRYLSSTSSTIRSAHVSPQNFSSTAEITGQALLEPPAAAGAQARVRLAARRYACRARQATLRLAARASAAARTSQQ